MFSSHNKNKGFIQIVTFHFFLRHSLPLRAHSWLLAHLLTPKQVKTEFLLKVSRRTDVIFVPFFFLLTVIYRK